MQSSPVNEGENMRMEWSSELNVSLRFEQCDYKNQSDPKAQQLNKQTLHQKKEQKLSTKSASSSSRQQLQKTIYQVANYCKPQKQYKSTTTAKNYDFV